MKVEIRMIMVLFFMVMGIFKQDISYSQCTIGSTAMTFGNYDIFTGIPLDATGTITINCVDEAWAEVKLGPSLSSGTFNPRRMRRSGGNDLLDYNIYTMPARIVILGDGTGGTETVRVHKPSGTPRREPWTRTISIYGRIFPGQNISAGPYSDTLTATVEW